MRQWRSLQPCLFKALQCKDEDTGGGGRTCLERLTDQASFGQQTFTKSYLHPSYLFWEASTLWHISMVWKPLLMWKIYGSNRKTPQYFYFQILNLAEFYPSILISQEERNHKRLSTFALRKLCYLLFKRKGKEKNGRENEKGKRKKKHHVWLLQESDFSTAGCFTNTRPIVLYGACSRRKQDENPFLLLLPWFCMS